MQLLRKYNKGVRVLLCVFHIYTKCVWVVPLKDRNDIKITNEFQKILNESGCKSNMMWIDQGSEFYTRSFKLWLHVNDIRMYSTKQIKGCCC